MLLSIEPSVYLASRIYPSTYLSISTLLSVYLSIYFPHPFIYLFPHIDLSNSIQIQPNQEIIHITNSLLSTCSLNMQSYVYHKQEFHTLAFTYHIIINQHFIYNQLFLPDIF